MKTTNQGKIWEFIGANIIPLITVLAGVIAIVLQTLQKLPKELEVPVILGVLCLLATQEIVERSKKLEHIEDLVQQNLDATKKVGYFEQVQVISGADEWYMFVEQRLKRAERSIDNVVLTPPNITVDTPAKRNFYITREKIIASGRVRYRYITRFYEPKRLARIVKYITEYGLDKSYFAAYFPVDLEEKTPVLNFFIVDGEEVITGPYRTPYVPGEKDPALAIMDSNIVQFYMDYFDFLWQKAIKLNDHMGCNHAVLERITKQIGNEKAH